MNPDSESGVDVCFLTPQQMSINAFTTAAADYGGDCGRGSRSREFYGADEPGFMYVVVGHCRWENYIGMTQSFTFPTSYWEQITINEGSVEISSTVDGSDTTKLFRLTDGDYDRVGLYFPKELGVTLNEAIPELSEANGVPCDNAPCAGTFAVNTVSTCSGTITFSTGVQLSEEVDQADIDADAEASGYATVCANAATMISEQMPGLT